MKTWCCFLVLVLSTLCGSLPTPAEPTFAAPDSMQQEITRALDDSTQAWNHGDLPGFMAGYLHSPQMSFTAAGRLIHGFDALQSRYEQTYGNSTLSMGQLTFSDVQVWALGPDHALAVGSWHLQLRPAIAYHPSSSKENPHGVFSLVMVRTPGGWKILHDHTSREEKPAK